MTIDEKLKQDIAELVRIEFADDIDTKTCHRLAEYAVAAYNESVRVYIGETGVTPEGVEYVVVPRAPTPAMVAIGETTEIGHFLRQGGEYTYTPQNIYLAMTSTKALKGDAG